MTTQVGDPFCLTTLQPHHYRSDRASGAGRARLSMAELLQSFAAFIQLYETTEGVPRLFHLDRTQSSSLHTMLWETLLLMILMDLTPAVLNEQALLTWLMPGQRDPDSSAILL